ncbi:serine/threonine-protein kinase ULK4-like [Dendronephthya gigantea]|uniref:serine/threonine-protein kinase ULK4-like n=1 Tax=Dendronephthya gigantea TaxID=151771 RepID=UPI00106DB855|nr:serine/threonine-protein kinase ULK4-like [Dendronephthya gigantea]
MENYVLYDELGRGTYSVVYKGRKKGSVEYVAVHCAEKTKRQELQNIVQLTHELSHDNIVMFYEWYETTNHIWMIVELCTGQSLSVMLEKDGCFPETSVQSFGLDIARGLHYLHGLGILYCDLRCSKLILDGYGKVKLSNFSLAKIEDECGIDENEGSINDEARRPSPMYMAPEVLHGHPHSVSSELWSFGCVLYELFTGRLPFEGDSFSELVTKVMTQNLLYPLQVINGIEMGPSDEFYSLVQMLLCKDKESRLSWSELLPHPFWEGRLQLSVDDVDEELEPNNFKLEKPVLEQEKPVLMHREEKEQKVLATDDGKFLKKSNLQQRVATKSKDDRPGQVIKQRPDSAPNSSSTGIQHGTYKVGQLRPHTTQSNLSKTRKLAKEVNTSKGKVSTKSSMPRKKQTKETIGMLSNDDKFKNKPVDAVPKSESKNHTLIAIEAVGGFDVENILYHSSDSIVTSIVDNPKIKKIVMPKWDAKTLGRTPLTAEQLQEANNDELTKYFKEILKLLGESKQSTSHSGGVGQRSKLHCAAYLMSIFQSADVANLVANSNLVTGFLQVIKHSPSADLKARLGLALGFLAGNATLISDTFNMSEVFMVLSETIRDNFRNSKLKQSLLPCLGEFLFYAATQEENEDRVNENWDVPGITYTIIVKCLREGEDSVVQHYAAKTIENVATTDTQHCEKFATAETAQMLWNLFTHCSGDSQKSTAISALCRLTGHSVALFQHVIDNAGLPTVLNNLVSGVTKVQQAIITMLAALVSKGAHTKRLIISKEFVHKVMHFLDSPSLVIRSKAFVAVAAMSREHNALSREHNAVSREHPIVSRENHVALLHCCQSRLVTYIERDAKRQTPVKGDVESLDYLRNCLNLCIQTVCRCVPSVLHNLLVALDAVSGRRHPSAVQSKELKSCIPLLSIVLHLVTSSVFRESVVNELFVQSLGRLVSHVASINKGSTSISSTPRQAPTGDPLTNLVLSIIEAIAQHPSLLLQYRGLVIENVLPHLAVLTSSKEGDVRMFCFKMFADVAAVFLDSETLNDDQGKESAMWLSKLITTELLPQYEVILQDQDPLPSYALKLLLAFLEHSPTFSEVVIEKEIVSILGEILDRHNGDVSGSTVQTIISLLDCLVSSTADLWPLYEQGLIDHVTTLFVSGAALINQNDDERNLSEVILPLLDTVHGIMKYSSKVVREAFQAKSTGDGAALTQKAEQVLLEGKPLVELTGVLVQFLCHYDSDIQEWALRCLYQVVELFGGTHEDAMSVENIRYFAEALLSSDLKKQKQILRIVKRLVTSSTWHAAALKERGDALVDAMVQITKVENVSEDTNAVKSLVVEITKGAGIA